MSQEPGNPLQRTGTATTVLLVACGLIDGVEAANPGSTLLLASGASIITAITFLRWFRLAYIDAERASPELFKGWDSGWAMASWFVPFLNLILPFLLVRRIWKAFALRVGESPEPPVYLNAWWGGLVLWLTTSRLHLPIIGVLVGAAGILGAGVVNALTRLAVRAAASARHSAAIEEA